VNIFELFFSQPSQIHGLSGGIDRLCNKSFVYSQLKHVTDIQTDGKAISIVQHLLHNPHQ